jgi:hypothetical protein
MDEKLVVFDDPCGKTNTSKNIVELKNEIILQMKMSVILNTLNASF